MATTTFAAKNAATTTISAKNAATTTFAIAHIVSANVISQTLPAITQSSAGNEIYGAAMDQTMPALTQTAVANAVYSATTAQSMPALTQSAAGNQIYTGTAAQSLPAVTQSASGSGGAELLLDTYPGAVAAYSLRKLRTAYSGSAIRVRESGGDTEEDIGFDANGDLDESALTTHCGANDGFVVKWYDQSSNSVDVSNSTSSQQPQIVTAGTIIKENLKPAIEWDGTNIYLESAYDQTIDYDSISGFSVANADNTSAVNDGAVWCFTESGEFGIFHVALASLRTPSIRVYTGDGDSGLDSVDMTDSPFGEQRLLTLIRDNDDVNTWLDGAPNASAADHTNTHSGSSIGVIIGGYKNGRAFGGTIQEVILYNSVKTGDRADIETNMNDYYSIY